MIPQQDTLSKSLPSNAGASSLPSASEETIFRNCSSIATRDQSLQSKSKTAIVEHLLDSNKISSNGKRKYHCKYCDFVAHQKSDLWKHKSIHMDPEKLLQCTECNFSTENKQHFDFHYRNHLGFKPFHCSVCDYKCATDPMLKSHMRIHSSVMYQCAVCRYKTKSFHIMKRRKRQQKRGKKLHEDGTPCSFVETVDCKIERESFIENKNVSDNPNNRSFPAQESHVRSNAKEMSSSTMETMLQQMYPTLYPFFFSDSRTSNPCFTQPLAFSEKSSYNCISCPFKTDDEDIFSKHRVLHVASENQDIAKLFGISSEFLQEQEMALKNAIKKREKCIESKESSEKSFLSTSESGYKSHGTSQSYTEEDNANKEGNGSPKYCRSSSPGNSDAYKGFSPNLHSVNASHFLDSDVHQKKALANGETSINFMLKENHIVGESPVDLSRQKSLKSTDKISGDVEKIRNIEPEISLLSSRLEKSNVPLTTRIKRKIDYAISDEQLAHQEFPEGNNNHNYFDSCENGVKDRKDFSKGQFEGLSLRVQAVLPDKWQYMYLPTAHAEYSHAREREMKMSSNSYKISQSSSNGVGGHHHSSSLNRKTKVPNSFIENTLLKSTTKIQKMEREQSQLLNSTKQDTYECRHCEIVFKNCAMYLVHKGYHGFEDPFKCNFCGHVAENAVEFFTHIGCAPHA